MKFLISLSMEIPAERGDLAIEKVNEFFTRLTVFGKPVKFQVEDVRIVMPDIPNED